MFWLILGIIAIPLVYITVLRVKKLHSKKMGLVPAPAATAGAGGNETLKYALSGVLAIVALVVFFAGVYSSTAWKSPSFSSVGSFSWSHWLQLLVLWGVCSALVALNKKALVEAGSILQKLFTGIIVMMFLVCPAIGLFEGSPTQKTAWTTADVQVLSMSSNGDSKKISAPPGHSVSFTGNGFETHCVYTDGSEGIVGNAKNPCKSGPMLYQFVRDTTGRPNSVTYRFN